MNDTNTREITISSQGDVWLGRLAWSSGQNAKIGFPMLREFHYDDRRGDYRGTLVQPDSGQEVSAAITCEDSATIRLTGHKGLLRKSTLWHRAAPQ
jgi:hypothetical protein